MVDTVLLVLKRINNLGHITVGIKGEEVGSGSIGTIPPRRMVHAQCVSIGGIMRTKWGLVLQQNLAANAKLGNQWDDVATILKPFLGPSIPWNLMVCVWDLHGR